MLAALYDRHPLIFSDRLPQSSDLPAGWIPLVDRILTDIEEALPTPVLAGLTITQIKEKYGSLRVGFFVQGDYHDVVDQIVEQATIDSEHACLECGDNGLWGVGMEGVSVKCEFCQRESDIRSARRGR